MSDISTKSVVIATVVVLAAMLVFSAFTFKPALDKSSMVLREEPITKNMKLQMQPGESYTYTYRFNESEANLTYTVYQSRECTGIHLEETTIKADVCLLEDGTDSKGYNSTFEKPTVIFFKPWMLALREGWQWNASMYVSMGGILKEVSSAQFRVLRNESYRGRQAFVVLENSTDGGIQYEWIDVEKRIVLKTSGEGYGMELVEGLPLNSSG